MAKDERGSPAIGGTPANGSNQAIIINCNEGVETTCTFKEALNKRMCMLNHWPMDPSEKSGTKRPELCRYTLLESIFWSLTIRMKQSDMLKPILNQFNGICPQAPVMKYEEFKKQTSKFVFKDGSSRDYKCLNRAQKIQLFQLFPTVEFIGLFNVNEAKRFLAELN